MIKKNLKCKKSTEKAGEAGYRVQDKYEHQKEKRESDLLLVMPE